jgi:halorhodopsin
MMLATVSDAITRGIVPLQTQGEALDAIQESFLLSSSFWVNIALAGAAILLFLYMGRDLQSSRAKLIWVATMLVPLVSISSYAGLTSGLTVGLLEMPAGHPLAGQGEIVSPWGRYLTWTFSTPAILAALGLLAGTDFTKLFTAITMDIGMCITGLAAALITSSLLIRWVFFGISTAFFLVVVYILLAEWSADAARAGTGEIFETLKNLTVVLWFGYPILWALGSEGLAILGVGVTSWGYSGLDILAKYVFAFLLLRWVANNESVVDSNPSMLGQD